MHGMTVKTRLCFKPHDVWIGVYWRAETYLFEQWIDLYICPLPMCCIRVGIKRRVLAHE